MGTSASFALARKTFACFIAALLSLALVPAFALAEDGTGVDEEAGASSRRVVASSQGLSAPDALPELGSTPAASSTEAADSSITLSEGTEGGGVEGSDTKPLTLASGLVGKPNSFINSDVILDSEPVIGSFTVDGLTYAVIDESTIELVGASEADAGTLMLPGFVAYADSEYTLASIAPYAFYLSGVTDVELPASVSDVDDRAFRSSDVANVAVAENNPTYSSFDGALYSADKTRLLLIPEGRVGAVLLPREAEVADPGKFSHCSLVDAISVEDGAAFASENGLLYTSDLTTLLRVPAGAAEITIREGCTTIVAGALEACAKLATINAPSTVTSISPDIFHAIPTISLPVASAQHDEAKNAVASGLPDQSNASADSSEVETLSGTQLTAMVALSSINAHFLEIGPLNIQVGIPDEANRDVWEESGFACNIASMESAKASSIEGRGVLRPDHNSYYNWICVPTSWCDKHDRVSTTNYHGPGYYPLENLWGLHYTGSYVKNWSLTDTGYARSYGISTPTSGVTKCEYSYYPEGPFYEIPAKGSATLEQREFFLWINGARSPIQATWDSGGVGDFVLDDAGNAVSSFSRALGPNIDVTTTEASNTECPQVTSRPGYRFLGWARKGEDGTVDASVLFQAGDTVRITKKETLYAQWERTEFDIGFDVDTEPGDADCKGEPKDDQTVNIEDGPTAIEDPKRPGYVFQGWTIPNAEGTEAIDQDLVYQDETDGKWYVDASKLPGYAGDDGRVELTARWSAAVKVDAPLSATFYYDLTLPDGEGYWDEARDAAVEGAAGAAGTAAIRNHSAVPLRVAGMESATGKDSARLLKKGDEWLNDLPKGEASVLSVFPTKSASTGTEDAALGPSSASQDKGDDLAHAVTLALDEVKLEAAFDADAWAIGAATVGDNGVVAKTGDLRLGYRLDLGGEGGVTLDYDALLAATEGDEGKAASLTSIAYCFALQAPRLTGTRSDPLYVEVTDPEVGSVGIYGLADIKAAADDFSSRVDPATDPNDWASISSQIAGSPYAKLYTELLEGGASFKLKVDGAYLDVQLIGIAQDTRSDNGRRAGLTFQTKGVYAYNNKKSNAAGGGTFNTQMNPLDKNDGGWQAMPLRERLRTTFMNSLDGKLSTAIVPLRKSQQIFGDIGASSLQNATGKEGETIWLPSRYELSGMVFDRYNESEAIGNSSYKPFQYHAFAGSNGSRLYNKYFNDSIPGWWTRSAYRSNRSIFCQVNGVDGRFSQNAAYAGGVAPCFAL